MDKTVQAGMALSGLNQSFDHIVSDWSLPVMVLDPDMCFVFANKSYLKSTQSEWADIKGRHVFDVFPDTPERVANVHNYFSRGLAGERTKMEEQPFVLLDDVGREITHYWEAVQEPLRGPDGTVTHVIQYCEDVTARVMAQKEQAIIAMELEHRVKNVMSVIQSVARITSRGHSSVEDFTKDFIARVNAMSRNHSRLYKNDFQGANLRDILTDELGAMSIDAGTAYTLSGDDVHFDAALSKDLSMVIHELTTNAVKYGCFNAGGGRLNVRWKRDGKTVKILWEESGVGPVGAIKRKGFGTKLIRMLRAIECDRIPTDDGLHVHIDIQAG